jgi:hypothetical protein
MTDQAPKLPRKPFGYDPSVVDQMLADRDSMLAMAERRVREAEGKVARLQEQVSAKDHALADLQQEVDAFAVVEPTTDSPPVEPDPEPKEEPLTPRFMTEELAKIIMAAEESTSQILSRARLSTRDQILEADRLWREVQSEVVRFANWRQQTEAAAGAVHAAIDHAREQIEAVPQRIQNALAEAVEALVNVDSQMAGFSGTSTLPLLATPSGLEEARARTNASSDAVGQALAAALDSDSFDVAPLDVSSLDADLDDDDLQPFAEPTGPSESDWPSLADSLSLGEEDRHEGGDNLAAEASQELRHFQSSNGTTEPAPEDGSSVWGA